MHINPALKHYIESQIFPKYDKYYSHGILHINNVIQNCLMLAESYNLDPNMSYVMASYHDVGLDIGRDNHEYTSGQVLINDQNLKQFFSSEQLNIMKEAIEDHRGSRKEPPRNFYGKILSDSDRDFDITVLAKRQLATSIKNYPEYHTFPQHFERYYQYIMNRLNQDGNFNLWTNHPILIKRRTEFQSHYLDKPYTESIYKQEWDHIIAANLLDKIKNYYEDY